MADKTRGRTERNHAKYVFQAALYFTPVTCYNSFRHWYAYKDSLNIHRTSNKGTKCQDIVLKCQAWERKKGKTSLWPLRREESRAQNRSQPVSHLLLSRLSRGSVHLQLDPLSQFYKKVKLARDREGPLAFQLQAWSVSCLSSSTWNVKSMRYWVLRLWQVQLQLYFTLYPPHHD